MGKTGLPNFWVDDIISRVTIRVKNTFKVIPKYGACDLCGSMPAYMGKSYILIAPIPDKMVHTIRPPVRLIGMYPISTMQLLPYIFIQRPLLWAQSDH